MDRLTAYFSSLLSAQVSSFSIIVAVLFVFIQILNKEYTALYISQLFRDLSFRVYLSLSVLLILIFGVATMLLSFESHDIVPQWDLHARIILLSPTFTIAVSTIFFLNFIPLLCFIVTNVWKLSPSVYIRKYADTLPLWKVEAYLFSKFGFPYEYRDFDRDVNKLSPELREKLLSNLKEFAAMISDDTDPKEVDGVETQDAVPTPDLSKNIESTQSDKSMERSERESPKESSIQAILESATSVAIKTQKSNKTIAKKRLRIERNMRKTGDILAIPLNVIRYNMHNYNRYDLESTYDAIIYTYSKWYKAFLAEKHLREYIVADYCSIMNELYRASKKEMVERFPIQCIRNNTKMIEMLLASSDFDNAVVILSALEKNASILTLDDEEDKEEILLIFRDTGQEIMEKVNDNKETIYNMLRAFSRVAEYIIFASTMKKQPLMLGMDNKVIFNDIIYCLDSFFEIQEEKRAEEYPLLLYDANYCIFRALYEKYLLSQTEHEKKYLEERLYSFWYNPRKLCIAELKVANVDGASLSVFRLIEVCNRLYESGDKKNLRDAVEGLLIAGFFAASLRTLPKADVFREGIPNMVLEAMRKYKSIIGHIDHHIQEILIKSHDHGFVFHDADDFLFDLAEVLESSFMLNFDWKRRTWNFTK